MMPQFAEHESLDLLADAALRLTSPDSMKGGKLNIAVERLINRLRAEAAIPDGVLTDSGLRLLKERLGDLLARTMLPSAEVESTRDRLGENGKLSPRQYRISYNHGLYAKGNAYRARQAHVEEAIKNADVVQHLRAVDGDSKTPLFSLYLRKSPNKNSDPFFWLIECQRQKSTLLPVHAWRLFTDEFDFSTGNSPVEFIEALAEKYGEILKIGDKNMHFAHNEIIALPANISTVVIQSSGLKMLVTGTENTTEAKVGYTYSILTEKYLKYLDKHGIGPI